jgi:hypothetical protein
MTQDTTSADPLARPPDERDWRADPTPAEVSTMAHWIAMQESRYHQLVTAHRLRQEKDHHAQL